MFLVSVQLKKGDSERFKRDLQRVNYDPVSINDSDPNIDQYEYYVYLHDMYRFISKIESVKSITFSKNEPTIASNGSSTTESQLGRGYHLLPPKPFVGKDISNDVHQPPQKPTRKKAVPKKRKVTKKQDTDSESVNISGPEN